MEVFWDYPQWDYIDPLPDQGMYRIRNNGKWGIIDNNQQVIIPCRWEYIGPVYHDFIFVKKCGLWGLLRFNGAMVAACEWSSITAVPDEPYCFLFSGKDKTQKLDIRSL